MMCPNLLLVKTEKPFRKRIQILTPEDLKKALPLGLALLEAGRILYDPRGFLEGWMKKLLEALQKGEIQRLSWHGQTYWRFKV